MTAMISTQGLTKRYGHTTVLDALDLEIEQGEVFGYLGPNGAGKSTTIALLLGLIRPTSGGARIFDLDVWRDARLVHRAPRLRAQRGEPVALADGRRGAPVPGAAARLRRHRLPRRARPALRARPRQEDPRLQPRQPAEGPAHRRVRQSGGPAAARRADDRARPADGAGLPSVRARGGRPGPDGAAVVPHPERGRGGLRSGGDAAAPGGSSRPAGSRCSAGWPRCGSAPSSTGRRRSWRRSPG